MGADATHRGAALTHMTCTECLHPWYTRSVQSVKRFIVRAERAFTALGCMTKQTGPRNRGHRLQGPGDDEGLVPLPLRWLIADVPRE